MQGMASAGQVRRAERVPGRRGVHHPLDTLRRNLEQLTVTANPVTPQESGRHWRGEAAAYGGFVTPIEDRQDAIASRLCSCSDSRAATSDLKSRFPCFR